ncbi:hypothetical protein [Streptomyces sp. KL116D]|uniref:hypothetical protein n=1 Tax=Streptomyces sp. KL116D TaxID=3045152 RepID=UPI003557EF92
MPGDPDRPSRPPGGRGPHGRRRRPYALTVPTGGSYVLAATASGHAPRASAATHHGEDRAVDVDLALEALAESVR